VHSYKDLNWHKGYPHATAVPKDSSICCQQQGSSTPAVSLVMRSPNSAAQNLQPCNQQARLKLASAHLYCTAVTTQGCCDNRDC